MDLLAERTPPVDRSVHAELLDGADHPVDCHPRHDLGVGEVPPRPANLPDPVVRLLPSALQELHDRELEVPCRAVGLEAHATGLVERAEHLAVDV